MNEEWQSRGKPIFWRVIVKNGLVLSRDWKRVVEVARISTSMQKFYKTALLPKNSHLINDEWKIRNSIQLKKWHSISKDSGSCRLKCRTLRSSWWNAWRMPATSRSSWLQTNTAASSRFSPEIAPSRDGSCFDVETNLLHNWVLPPSLPHLPW